MKRSRGDCKFSDKPVDYDAAAHALFASLGIDKPKEVERYNHADVVYQHPSGGKLFIGNEQVART